MPFIAVCVVQRGCRDQSSNARRGVQERAHSLRYCYVFSPLHRVRAAGSHIEQWRPDGAEVAMIKKAINDPEHIVAEVIESSVKN